MPVSKGPQDPSVSPQPEQKRDVQSAPSNKEGAESKPAGRAGDRSRPRCPRTTRKERGGKRRRPRSPRRRPPASSAGMVDKSVYEERMGAWLAGEDSRGSLRDKCKNCYIGLRTLAPKREGRSRQDLGSQRYLPCRARDCERKRARHWARDCPNRPQLNERSRRPAF